MACEECGERHWRNPKPAAGTLTTLDGRLLLVRRAIEPWAGRWCAPSGFCEFDEHPIVTAERETFEEAGVSVRVTGYLGTWMSYYAEDDLAGTGRDDDVVIAVAYYHAEPIGDPPAHVDRDEVSELGWFGADELPSALAPPAALPRVLASWRAAVRAGTTRSVMPDRPD